MPTLRAKSEDKFSQARAAKNSPERQEAARKRKDTPPKSVQAELDRVAASRKKTPRGPSSAKPKSAKERHDNESQQPNLSKKEWVARRDALPKIRDEERVFNLVHAILTAWKADVGRAEHTAASAGIIKVSRRKIEGALRDLKNTRFTKIPSLINDVLVYNEIFHEFGQWVYVEHDSPDWIFVRLPENSTPVIRADISYDSQSKSVSNIVTSSEALLPSFDDEEEDVIPENVEYDDATEDCPKEEEDEDEEEDDEFDSWTLSELQNHAKVQGYMGPKDIGWKDRHALIERILNKGAIK